MISFGSLDHWASRGYTSLCAKMSRYDKRPRLSMRLKKNSHILYIYGQRRYMFMHLSKIHKTLKIIEIPPNSHHAPT